MDKTGYIIEGYVDDCFDDYLNDLALLLSIPSVSIMNKSEIGSPFGGNVRKAMDAFISIADRLGYTTHDDDGYAVYGQLGDKEEYICALGHLDVVTAEPVDEWHTFPYQLIIQDGVAYGRGVNDDKGPLLASLYAGSLAWRLCKRPKYSLRVIAGGAEETSWDGIRHYFQHEEQPIMGFSPDGNFPVVNGEMGILQVKLIFTRKTSAVVSSIPDKNYVCEKLLIDGDEFLGDKVLSRHPDRGRNAIEEYVKGGKKNYQAEDWYRFIRDRLYEQTDGRGLDIQTDRTDMLPLSVCMMSLRTNNIHNMELSLDIRYPKEIKKEEILDKLENLSINYYFSTEVMRDQAPLFVEEDSVLVQSLLDSYQSVMGDRPRPLIKGGASYARVLKNGVCFGASFAGEEPHQHMANEQEKIDSLKKAIQIYTRSFLALLDSNYG